VVIVTGAIHMNAGRRPDSQARDEVGRNAAAAQAAQVAARVQAVSAVSV
jgi:hypothetical protein